MRYSTLYCRAHGLFARAGTRIRKCPACNRPGEPIPSSFARLPQLDALLDPELTAEALLSLRQLAFSAHSGFLTREEAAKGAFYINGRADFFSSDTSPEYFFQLAEALSEILKARFADTGDLSHEGPPAGTYNNR